MDILDIVLVSFLLYQLYKLLKGSLAYNIFLGLVLIYLVYLLVTALDMQLMSGIFEQFINIGVLALLIVFQPEVRRFLLLLGKRGFFGRRGFLSLILLRRRKKGTRTSPTILAILNAVKRLSKTKTGALIILSKNPRLLHFTDMGVPLNADVNSDLLETIFFKNSPLHDGAALISDDKIMAAKCILPVSDDVRVPFWAGLRHRSAVGITENTDALTIIVSEETGGISYAQSGTLYTRVTADELKEVLKAVS